MPRPLTQGSLVAALILAITLGGCLPATLRPSDGDPSANPPPSAAIPTATIVPTTAPDLGVADLVSMRWQPTELQAADGELVLAIAPWNGGFVAAGTSMDFSRLEDAAPSGNPMAALMRAEFWRSDDGRHWIHLPPDDAFVGASIRHLVQVGNRLLAIGSMGICLPDACGGLPPNGGTAVWESTDGTVWARLPDGGLEAAAVKAVVVTGDGLVAGGYVASDAEPAEGSMTGRTDAAIWRSADGREWSRSTIEAHDATVIHLTVGRSGSVAALVRSDTFYARRRAAYEVWRSTHGDAAWERGEAVADLTIDRAGSFDGNLITAWWPGDRAGILDISPVGNQPSRSTRPGALGALSTTSITDTGLAVLVAGNALDADGEEGVARMFASGDLAAWTELSVPAEWLDSAPWIVASGAPGVVAVLHAPTPVSTAPATVVWLGSTAP